MADEPAPAPRPLPTAPGIPTGNQGAQAAIKSSQYFLPSHAFLFFCAIQQSVYPRGARTCTPPQHFQLIAAFIICLAAGVIDKAHLNKHLGRYLSSCIRMRADY